MKHERETQEMCVCEIKESERCVMTGKRGVCVCVAIQSERLEA